MSIIKRKAGSEDIVKSILEFDEVPTEGSPNLVESGAVEQAIAEGGKIAVFHVTYPMGQTVYPAPDEILAAIDAGKFVVIDQADLALPGNHTEWLLEYTIRGEQDYIKFVNGSSTLFATRDNTADEPTWQWDTGNLYDDQLDANSTNAVQNSTLYTVIGNVETLLAAL